MAMDISGILRTGPDSRTDYSAKDGRESSMSSFSGRRKAQPPLEVEGALDAEEIKQALEQVKLYPDQVDKRLKFRVSEEMERVIVTIIDRNTGEVLKEIPPKEIQQLHKHIQEAMGLLFDKKI